MQHSVPKEIAATFRDILHKSSALSDCRATFARQDGGACDGTLAGSAARLEHTFTFLRSEMSPKLLRLLPLAESVVLEAISQSCPEMGDFSTLASTVTECSIDGNSAGYFLDIIYQDFDPRMMDFRTVDKARIRKFRCILSINQQRPYGMYVTYLDRRAVGSELFTMDTIIPEEVTSVDIEDLSEM
jgi:hypothetical protein